MIEGCSGPASFPRSPEWRADSCAPSPRSARNDRAHCMKIRIAILAALGLALVLYLVKFVGLSAVLASAVQVGWGGFALLCAYSLSLFVLLGTAWWVLLPDSIGRGLWLFVRARMVRDAAAEVLPLSQLGGIVFGVRA